MAPLYISSTAKQYRWVLIISTIPAVTLNSEHSICGFLLSSTSEKEVKNECHLQKYAFVDEISRVREESKLIGTKKVVILNQLASQSWHNEHNSLMLRNVETERSFTRRVSCKSHFKQASFKSNTSGVNFNMYNQFRATFSKSNVKY